VARKDPRQLDRLDFVLIAGPVFKALSMTTVLRTERMSGGNARESGNPHPAGAGRGSAAGGQRAD
jgi:hypothetical protein